MKDLEDQNLCRGLHLLLVCLLLLHSHRYKLHNPQIRRTEHDLPEKIPVKREIIEWSDNILWYTSKENRSFKIGV